MCYANISIHHTYRRYISGVKIAVAIEHVTLKCTNQRVGAPLQLLRQISAGRVAPCAVLVECASSLEIPLASGDRPARI